jgi:hypothetical protein
MRKAWVAVLGLALVCAVALSWRTAAASGVTSDEVKLASLIHDIKSLDPAGLQALHPIAIHRWQVPGPGVDVMRARVEETYSVDGVGQDTVELTGWVAVKHGQAYAADGASEITWNNAILPTEFVELDLHGTSALFGPVHVTLDRDRPSYGRVGRIEIPELAKHNLQARLVKNDAAAANDRALAKEKARSKSSKSAKPAATDLEATPPPDPVTDDGGGISGSSACRAEANARIEMPNLGIEMTTTRPVLWYSLVDTIPPVGHNASIAVEPVRLVSKGREVATLSSGIVKFREVVRQVPLSATAADRVATKN